MWRTDSFEKTLMLGKIEGGRRKPWQKMRWMDGITDSMDTWVNSGSWWWTGRPGVLQSTGSQRVGHDWATSLFFFHVSMSHVNIKPWRTSASSIFISEARLTEWYASDSDEVWHKISFSINSWVKDLLHKCIKLVKMFHLKGKIVWLWGGASPDALERPCLNVPLCPHENDSVLMEFGAKTQNWIWFEVREVVMTCP